MFSPTVPQLEAPSGVSVSAIKSTSVQVSWQAVENADRYTVILAKIKELGLCSFFHVVSVDTTSSIVVVGQNNDNRLRAYTTYSITVVAKNDEGNFITSRPSKTIKITTKQTGT